MMQGTRTAEEKDHKENRTSSQSKVISATPKGIVNLLLNNLYIIRCSFGLMLSQFGQTRYCTGFFLPFAAFTK